MDGTFPNGLRYTAYGQKAWQTGGDWQPVDFLFAGESGYITEYSDEQNPGVALLYLQQRYYDPDVGRFLTPDPIGFAGGLNLYAYCGNDPVNRVDPSGTDDVDGDGDDDGIPMPSVGTPGQIGTGGPPMCSPVRNNRPVSAFPSRPGCVPRPPAVASNPGLLSRAGARLRATGRAVVDFFSRGPASATANEVGAAREARVAQIMRGSVSREKIKVDNVGSTDIDVVGGRGELVGVGGYHKSYDSAKLGHKLNILKTYADSKGKRAMYFFEEGTPRSAIDLAKQKLGPKNVRTFRR